MASILVVIAIWRGGILPGHGGYLCDPALEGLLLDASALPGDAIMTEPKRLPSLSTSVGGGGSACEAAYSAAFGHASHAIYRYGNVEATVRAYQQLSAGAFAYRREFDLPWSRESLSFATKLGASEILVMCTPRYGLVGRCAALARYGNILSLYDTEMNPDQMALADFLRIVVAIDHRLADVTESELP